MFGPEVLKYLSIMIGEDTIFKGLVLGTEGLHCQILF